MMGRSALILQVISLPFLVSTACNGRPDQPARILLRLDLPARSSLTKDAKPRPIADSPLVLWASIDAKDMASAVTGQWTGSIDQTPSLELSVDAGANRSLSVLLFSLAGDHVETYRGLQTGLTLLPGDQTISIALERAPEWTLRARLLPEGPAPSQAAVMEVQTRVLFPARPVVEDQGAWSVTMDHLPQGRFFYLLLRSEDGTWSAPLTACPLWSTKGDLVDKTISLPDGACQTTPRQR